MYSKFANSLYYVVCSEVGNVRHPFKMRVVVIFFISVHFSCCCDLWVEGLNLSLDTSALIGITGIQWRWKK